MFDPGVEIEKTSHSIPG